VDILRHSLRNLIKIQLDDEVLGKLAWKDFGNGLSMSRLAREGSRELVLYRIREGADPCAFLRHEHPGGEVYWVLRGGIEDENGVYSEGDFVYLDSKSVHSPRAIGETLVLVLWPAGVKIVEGR
jgi:anti-sigma factor ChrR (cupin superfamily)